ncbi:MAG: hypothetical protein A2428_03370 [Bdellovibrionales bacterium RIFOXYC1_FULL_54_43]|nr:MAG: hypothetical protein A2428_03370 [Bdellovibrionales bacterium RIFOXYC1_FULL_54_43]OFZ84600.1 MAG: hypothetical protein A2603_11900 [Bdellovibrionales bacterium RIFOXYD1_FULL_55_31]
MDPSHPEPELERGPEDDEETDTPPELHDDVEPSETEIAESASTLPSTEIVVERELVSSSVHDPVRRYLEEIRRYALLDPEEEFRLAMKLRSEGDMQAARILVSANLRLVVKIALEYRTYYSNLLDLIQEGNIGLMKAVSKFDPTKGARLGYYASWWIRSYILKYLLDNFRLVKIGTTQAQKKLFYHLMREKERLEAQGLLSGPKLLAEKLNVREKDVIEMEQRLSGRGTEMSLDTPIDSEGGSHSHLELLADSQESADGILEREQLLAMLRSKLPEFQTLLNEKELSILKERLLSEEPKTLQEVANKYGLTRERARQIEVRVIDKLREFLKQTL